MLTTTGFIVASPSDSASKLVPGGTAHIHSHGHTYVRYEAGLSVPGEEAASYRIDRDYTLCWVLAGTNEPKQLTTEKIDPRACSLLFVHTSGCTYDAPCAGQHHHQQAATFRPCWHRSHRRAAWPA
jgi:hypothetical protein